MQLNRRTIFSATGITLTTWPSVVRAPAKQRESIETAIGTICCDGFGDEDSRHAFQAIPRLGVKNVGFSCWSARNLTPTLQVVA